MTPPKLHPNKSAEALAKEKLSTVPMTVTAGSGNKQTVDARAFAYIVGYPGAGGTITHSVLHDPTDTDHGDNLTGPSAAGEVVEINVRANFYMLEAATADAVFHLIP